jgi:hypothetical protein
VSIKEEHLLAILESSSIQVDEVHVFAAAQRWGKEELRRRKLEDSPENLRAVLAKALKLVRFPTMKLDDIINTVSLLGGRIPCLRSPQRCSVFNHVQVLPSGVLSAEESLEVLTYVSPRLLAPDNELG